MVLLTGSVRADEADRDRPVTLAFSNTDVRAVLETLAALAGVAPEADDAVTGTIDFSVDEEPALASLRRAAGMAGARVTEHRPGVFVVRKGP